MEKMKLTLTFVNGDFEALKQQKSVLSCNKQDEMNHDILGTLFTNIKMFMHNFCSLLILEHLKMVIY